ncbi:hypothetical protein NAU58_15980 [Pseudomonas stutzeri]|uniref:hypothetical protein n=1 Tax=Stutzerimonas stutzeri TaxID=316 RepID=UPI0011AEEA27|nr:hypothetical protein [Stutzerimonas stutzeri]MCQ4297076.1 hypothetical protein [Stutzerimonas stutzeri]
MQSEGTNVKCDKKGQVAMVWADGHSFREVAPIQENAIEGAQINRVPLAEKMFTEARIAAVLLGPLLIDLPQG